MYVKHGEDFEIQALRRALDQETIAEGIIVSMSRKGNCYDSAVIESFHSVLKKNGYIRKNMKFEKKRNPVFSNILRYFTIENVVILH